MATKKISRKDKAEKRTQPEANLGQTQARLEKEKESELSRMGETSRGSEPIPKKESQSD
jgi:hypothetical protein